MKKLSIILLVMIFHSSARAAQFPNEYTLYCKGEKSTGFNWRENNWQEQKFYPSDYIVSKWKTNFCFEFIFVEPKNYGVSKEVCVNIRVAGEEYSPAVSGKCLEYTAPVGAKWSDYLQCEGKFTGQFITKLDGWFHRSSIHNDLDVAKAYKDSILTAVGKCSQIK